MVPERALLLVLGGALAYSAAVSVRQLHADAPVAAPGRDDLVSRFRLAGAYHDPLLGGEVEYHATRVGLGAAAMFGAGVLSGLLGIASGAFKVVAMDHVMRLPIKVSTATSNFMIGITAAASAGIYFGRGDIHPLLATPVALGILLGAFAGTRMMARLRNRTIRALFLPVILYLAASLILEAVGIRLR